MHFYVYSLRVMKEIPSEPQYVKEWSTLSSCFLCQHWQLQTANSVLYIDGSFCLDNYLHMQCCYVKVSTMILTAVNMPLNKKLLLRIHWYIYQCMHNESLSRIFNRVSFCTPFYSDSRVQPLNGQGFPCTTWVQEKPWWGLRTSIN